MCFFKSKRIEQLERQLEILSERLSALDHTVERISRKGCALESSHSNLVDEVQQLKVWANLAQEAQDNLTAETQEMKVWAELAEKIFKRPEAAQAQNQADSNISADT